MEFERIGTQQYFIIIVGIILFVAIPIAIALIWKKLKSEPISTILTGAAAFILFALILEKPIQNVLIFPTLMGLPEHAASRIINANPYLWAFMVGLFPGIFEETGRLIAFKTVLKNRKNRETSISYGIGHGGVEVMVTMLTSQGLITCLIYAVMINTGAFSTVVEQAKTLAPEQVDQLIAFAGQIAAFSFADLGMMSMERFFACLVHVGASILVFYACKDKKKLWLYPLAIILHTLIDGFAGLYMKELVSISPWMLEGVIAVCSTLIFCGAYFMLYRKDNAKDQSVLECNRSSE